MRAPRPHHSGSTTCTSRPRGSRPGTQGQWALPSPAGDNTSKTTAQPEPVRVPPTQHCLRRRRRGRRRDALWRRRDVLLSRETSRRQGAALSRLTVTHSPHTHGVPGGGRHSFTSLRAGISLGPAQAWPLWVPAFPQATPGPLGSGIRTVLIPRTFQSQHRLHTARSSEEEASKPTTGPGANRLSFHDPSRPAR